ncbi:MAG: hypothetical protein ACEPOW_04465 [Bacteroidales bacterium]
MTICSYYSICGTPIKLQSPLQEINTFCDFMLYAFKEENLSESECTLVSVERNLYYSDYYDIYKNGQIAFDFGMKMKGVHYSVMSKALENIVSGHAINQIDKKELISLHSGAISKNNKGILILGESGDGKSTFTLEMVAQHNYEYLSDEIGLLDKELFLHPFIKTVSFKPGIVKLNDSWICKRFANEFQVKVPEKLYGQKVPLKAIFTVKYNPDNQTSIQPMQKKDMLKRLFNAQIGRERYIAEVGQIADIVKRVPVYRIEHNSASEAAKAVDNLLFGI